MRWGPLFASLAFLALGCAANAQPQAASAESGAEVVRRLGAILDYVAADYASAVRQGRVVDEAEYAEQTSFLADARRLAGQIPPSSVDVAAELAAVLAQVEAKADATEVATRARSLRRRVLDAHGVVMAPTATPSRERGAALFAQACVACHGAGGGGDGAQAARLDPRPRSFLDAEVMADLSPARAFNALTDGIRGTAMASFGTLPAADRWSLAFYVFTLRHDPSAAVRGEGAWKQAGRIVAAAPTRLSGMSDGEIDRALAQAGLDAPARREGLSFLRLDAPYRATGAPFDEARRLLQTGILQVEKGAREAATTAFNAAYLDGFEPHEGALRARDPALVVRVEDRFLALRELCKSGADGKRVTREALTLGALLDRAEESLAGEGRARLAFVGALVVILREGVEAALLVLLLLGVARRTTVVGKAQPTSSVHLGWLVAVLAGVVTWFASAPLVRLGGARRELMEGVIALLAAGMLLYAGHFVLARADARRRVEALKAKLAQASPGLRRRWLLGGLAFVAVYREAIEVVLFLRAIALDAPLGVVLAGVATGGVLLFLFVALVGRLGRRLKPGPLLGASGTLLCALAVVLAGKGVRALQEAGVLGIRPLTLPRVEWLGVFPSLEGVLTQVLVLVAFLAIAAAALWRARAAAVPT